MSSDHLVQKRILLWIVSTSGGYYNFYSQEKLNLSYNIMGLSMKKHHFLIMAACLTLLSACSTPQHLAPSPTPSLTSTLGETQGETQGDTPGDTPAPADSASSRPAPSLTTTLTPRLTASPSCTFTPLPNRRYTPMTLMLHKPNHTFDSVAFLEEFIKILQAEKM
jgi:hypothetical protein